MRFPLSSFSPKPEFQSPPPLPKSRASFSKWLSEPFSPSPSWRSCNTPVSHLNGVLISNRLKAAGYKVRFCTNEDQCTRQGLVDKLGNLGFNLSASEILSPCPIGRKLIEERKLRPYLLIHPSGLLEFTGLDCNEPNCVLIGGAEELFTYENMNGAFRVLLNSDEPVLMATGYG